MEFSFDRPNKSDSQSPQNRTQNSSRPEVSNSSSAEEIDVASIANERLRKAIERNREKQRAREVQSGQTTHNNQSQKEPLQNHNANFDQRNIHQSAWAQHQAHTGANNPREEMQEAQSGLFDEQNTEQVEVKPNPRSTRIHARERFAKFAKTTNNENAEGTVVEDITTENILSATRRAPARPDDTEFTPVKRTSRKVASQISYTTGTSKRRNKPIDPLLVDYFVKGVWLFLGFLVLRLMFAQGGVTAYYSQKTTLKNRIDDLAKIKSENMVLVREIEKMQNDSGYQKKLVRDNLGFIAQDEYLILFPKEKAD